MGLGFFVGNCLCRYDHGWGIEIVHGPYLRHDSLDRVHTTRLFRSRYGESGRDLIDNRLDSGYHVCRCGVRCREPCFYLGYEPFPS